MLNPGGALVSKITPENTLLGRTLAPIANPYTTRSYDKAAGVGFQSARDWLHIGTVSMAPIKTAPAGPVVSQPKNTVSTNGLTYSYDPSTDPNGVQARQRALLAQPTGTYSGLNIPT